MTEQTDDADDRANRCGVKPASKRYSGEPTTMHAASRQPRLSARRLRLAGRLLMEAG
jgi:hypothetical protein